MSERYPYPLDRTSEMPAQLLGRAGPEISAPKPEIFPAWPALELAQLRRQTEEYKKTVDDMREAAGKFTTAVAMWSVKLITDEALIKASEEFDKVFNPPTDKEKS
jgi:hypothetical protein